MGGAGWKAEGQLFARYLAFSLGVFFSPPTARKKTQRFLFFFVRIFFSPKEPESVAMFIAVVPRSGFASSLYRIE